MKGSIGSHIKAVIFDFDDTLVATLAAKSAHHKHVARKYFGKTLTDEQILKHWGAPLTTMTGLLYGQENSLAALDILIKSDAEFPKPLLEDTLGVLESIRASGKLLGVVTAISTDKLIDDLKMATIPIELFDYMQGEEKTEYHKPDPRVFEPTIDWLKSKSVKPSEVVYVGDALRDMQAALGAGFEFIGVSTGLVTQKEFNKHNVPSINRLGQLI